MKTRFSLSTNDHWHFFFFNFYDSSNTSAMGRTNRNKVIKNSVVDLSNQLNQKMIATKLVLQQKLESKEAFLLIV